MTTKLNDMRITGMAGTCGEKGRNPNYQQMSFGECFSLLVNLEMDTQTK